VNDLLSARDLLPTLERYYDAVPRTSAYTESIGPFTLFVSESASWPFYARPTLGASAFTADDVRWVRQRQRALNAPEAFEWVAETSPGVQAAVAAAGLPIHEHPLMVLDRAANRTASAPTGLALRLVRPDEDDIGMMRAVAWVGFGASGTAIGPEGAAELAAAIDEQSAEATEFARQRLRVGYTFMAAAFVDGLPVAVGSHQPVHGVSEVVGVATLPTHRRQGIGAALTRFLVDDALSRGVETIFLSAGDDDVARIYERAGFRRIGTACIAESTAIPAND
jgi:ribosomal protein S18 acetylase RimI-like enzyme